MDVQRRVKPFIVLFLGFFILETCRLTMLGSVCYDKQAAFLYVMFFTGSMRNVTFVLHGGMYVLWHIVLYYIVRNDDYGIVDMNDVIFVRYKRRGKALWEHTRRVLCFSMECGATVISALYVGALIKNIKGTIINYGAICIVVHVVFFAGMIRLLDVVMDTRPFFLGFVFVDIVLLSTRPDSIPVLLDKNITGVFTETVFYVIQCLFVFMLTYLGVALVLRRKDLTGELK